MRLINCQTFAFEQSYQPETLKYAILSHRWGSDEVTYQEMLGDHALLETRSGYQKIISFREKVLALRDPSLTHIWIDTCCIDKSSSAELSEAINSMYTWYLQSTICLAFLHDFDHTQADVQHSHSSPVFTKTLSKSAWFYRSWTLQELIAPEKVWFYDCHWRYFGDKNGLTSILSTITNIPFAVLTQEVSVHSLPVAQRMSWAGNRICERPEDVAYSLLGIFDVSMPMLYGEGLKAFTRLQEEIIRKDNDHTIFLGRMSLGARSSMLASHPKAFNPAWKYRTHRRYRTSFAITNNGLAIPLLTSSWQHNVHLALLNCEVAFDTQQNWMQPGILLTRMSYMDETGRFERLLTPQQDALVFLDHDSAHQIALTRNDIEIDLHTLQLMTGNQIPNKIVVQDLLLNETDVQPSALDAKLKKYDAFAQTNVATRYGWLPHRHVALFPKDHTGNVVTLHFNEKSSPLIQAMQLGLNTDHQFVCIFVTQSHAEELTPAWTSSAGIDMATSRKISAEHFVTLNDWQSFNLPEGFRDRKYWPKRVSTKTQFCLMGPPAQGGPQQWWLFGKILDSSHNVWVVGVRITCDGKYTEGTWFLAVACIQISRGAAIEHR